MKPDQAKALREPFPREAIGYLPKGGARLAYVGHAATTDRLLSVDPEWSWEPVAFDPRGLPGIDEHGGLWIRLTVAGVTRLGYGHASGKKGPDAIKEAIGDAIRNAAMRFGVALDLWAKEDISATTAAIHDEPERPAARLASVPADDPFYVDTATGEVSAAAGGGEAPAAADPDYQSPPFVTPGGAPTKKQSDLMWVLLGKAYGDDVELKRAAISDALGRDVESTKTLTSREVSKVIDALKAAS